eukprot:TRINITY_DN93723_c0_g1_i1.p1 TRINITY_DN93723_c0_g1~~TRINITY_DN93723_c0_g1_i1.p1  ORF type:complete len:284 (-),score=93.88 TRINITY_DN93723_c0_g1_i1:8-859(-)
MPYGVHINGFRCADLAADGSEVTTQMLFVGGLPPNVMKNHVLGAFMEYGTVVDCILQARPGSPGMAFVKFTEAAAVQNVVDTAYRNTGMLLVLGKWVEVRKATPENKTGPIAPVTGPPRRAVSPHAGSRSMREEFLASRGLKEADLKRKKSESSSSSSSSTSAKKKKKRKKDKKKKKSKSKSSASSCSSSSSVCLTGGAEKAKAAAELSKEAAAASDPEVEKAKHEAFKRLVSLKTVEPKDARMKAWRALLREWHPDKNPERVEVATAVFQFLQKGKAVLDAE